MCIFIGIAPIYMRTTLNVAFTLCFLLTVQLLPAQSKKSDKYPSLLWEITGNGLKKPSYLFGTMHVSNKMVFHLGDSFYNAIRSAETVALELNPDIWQSQMVRLEKLKENYARFSTEEGNDFLVEKSFRLADYMDELKLALSTEPAIVNNLLYRSYKVREDFEEDTFLDLYIFQTGRKLGKKPAGVEQFYEAEKLVLEAYADMAKEKKKKNLDLGDESPGDIMEKMQNAYRKGDLDLMDSLDMIMERSPAFREKFLYRRNELQADAMDSIMRHSSLFVGVGAAHLPGSRGVIEILRKKGYRLRPVKMSGRDTQQKATIDPLKVPVQFQKKTSEDGFYSVEVPGELYHIRQDYFNLDRRQYADMSNGSYYMVTRVKTYGALLNQPPAEVLRKTDSILYENIPGKILRKTAIEKNGYRGFDIQSKTRRGDMQRYQIFATPFEILVFKMSGKENYIEGKEGEKFFGSIYLEPAKNKTAAYRSGGAGFSITFPQSPLVTPGAANSMQRWEFQASDSATGHAYLVMKQTVQNVDFISEDSFDLALMEESFRNPDLFGRQLERKMTMHHGYPALEVKEQLKDSSIIQALFVARGPHLYTVAMRSGNKNLGTSSFFDSFKIEPFVYSKPQAYIDTFLNISVQTPVAPELDEEMRRLAEEATEQAYNGSGYSGYYSYWPKPKHGVFKSDSTGEMIAVKVQQFPRYFYIRDSAKYWQGEVEELTNKGDLMIRDSVHVISHQDIKGIRFSLKDTASGKLIHHMLAIKNDYQYQVSTISDSISGLSDFASAFFNSIQLLPKKEGRDITKSRLPLFFADLFSKDSAEYNKAYQSLSSLYYGPDGIPYIKDALNRLNRSDKNYFEVKGKLIAELGYIRDSNNLVVPLLKQLYEKTADTSLFQNEVVKSLARAKTAASYAAMKEILLLDPPVFSNTYDYSGIFSSMEDTLQLSASLFPELLQLATLDDYKGHITELLVKMVDSGHLNPKVYESYLPSMYIDARIALKKQLARDETSLQEASKKEADGDTEAERTYRNNNVESSLVDYSVLLMPFYNENKNIRQYFDKLLSSRDEDVRLSTAVLMLRKNKQVPDSVIYKLAADDKYRHSLYKRLEKLKQTDRFPVEFKTQPLIARSALMEENDYDKLDSLQFLCKHPVSLKGKTGVVYFYQYRIRKEDQWKIGMSGLQPEMESALSTKDEITTMTDVKITEDESLEDQLNRQLKKMLFGLYRGGKYFFNEYRGFNSFRAVAEYED